MRLIDKDNIDITPWCVPIHIAAEGFQPLLEYIDDDGKIDLGNHMALSVYNQAVAKVIAGLEISIPPPNLIPTICLRHSFLIVLMDGILKRGDMIIEIGTGASAIIALLAAKLYDLRVIATEIDTRSFELAKMNVEKNHLTNKISLVMSGGGILSDVISANISTHAVLCNPPIYPDGDKPVYETVEKGSGFRGTVSEMIGGGDNGFDFIDRLISEAHKLRITHICLLLIFNDHAEIARTNFVNLGRKVRRIELQAGTRKRYIVVGSLE